MRVRNITISLSKGSHAVDTKNLEFLSLDKPVRVTGRFEYCIRDESGDFISYKNIRVGVKNAYIFMIPVFSCI